VKIKQMKTINKLRNNESLTKDELAELLTAKGELQEELFATAREIRNNYHGDRVMLRGVIETSSHCEKNCNYCAMRASNKELERYRIESPEKILEVVDEIKNMGIPVVFLQSGQDRNLIYNNVIDQVIPEIKKRGLKVLLCVGERPKETYQKWFNLGADSYILKFETSSPNFYKKTVYTSLPKRLQCIYNLQEIGYKIGTGNIVGLPGQDFDTLLEDIFLAIKIKPNFVSTSPFIPNPNTPYQDEKYGDVNLALNTMAIYRVALKKCLIPTVSALEKIEKDGQLMGLNAGANVITINFTPPHFREQYRIYSDKRFVVKLDHARNIIHRAGLEVETSTTFYEQNNNNLFPSEIAS
jgi:biotin synthase